MFIFERDFFSLVVKFADKIQRKHTLSYNKVLFAYTPIYVRLLGFADEQSISEINPKWQSILKQLPRRDNEQVDFFYRQHLQHEHCKTETTEQWFGCFRYHYHEKDNSYELHFRASDLKGNLSSSRINQRRKELALMFQYIHKENRQNAKFFARTWLLNTEAFTRLFPKEFKEKTQLWPEHLTQDNTYWGQFVNRNGKLKRDLSKKLITNVDMLSSTDIRDYFPLKGRITEIPLELLFRFYNI